MVVLDLLRLLVGVSVLSFASYTDWKWRRAPNVLWFVVAGAGVVLLLLQLALDFDATLARWPYLVAIPVFAALVYALWYFGLIAGGADAKALMALALLLPFPLEIGPWTSPLPGAAVVLVDSLLVFMVIPLSFVVWNVAHGDFRFPHLALGFKRAGALVRRGHLWPLETVAEDGKRGTKLFASRMTEEEIDGAFSRIQALGDERVWVTPKVPFMIPMLVGLVLAFGAGDVLSVLLAQVVPHR